MADRWTVLGVISEERDDNLTERRVWLHGERSGRRAWLLDHAFGGRGFTDVWMVGTAVEATMAFFPGRSRLRALAAESTGGPGGPAWPRLTLDDEWQLVARRIAACPWVSLHPVVIAGGTPLRRGEDGIVVAGGRGWPMTLGDADTWQLLGAGGGMPR